MSFCCFVCCCCCCLLFALCSLLAAQWLIVVAINFVLFFYCLFIKTPRWSSLNYYDKLHRCLASVVYCVTEREAANLGIFLQETLRLLERWNNPRIYTNECANKPGFSISIRQASGQRATFDQYVKIFGKWHSKVSRWFFLCLVVKQFLTFSCFLGWCNAFLKHYYTIHSSPACLLQVLNPVNTLYYEILS